MFIIDYSKALRSLRWNTHKGLRCGYFNTVGISHCNKLARRIGKVGKTGGKAGVGALERWSKNENAPVRKCRN